MCKVHLSHLSDQNFFLTQSRKYVPFPALPFL
jgi:hypothetical protein